MKSVSKLIFEELNFTPDLLQTLISQVKESTKFFLRLEELEFRNISFQSENLIVDFSEMLNNKIKFPRLTKLGFVGTQNVSQILSQIQFE